MDNRTSVISIPTSFFHEISIIWWKTNETEIRFFSSVRLGGIMRPMHFQESHMGHIVRPLPAFLRASVSSVMPLIIDFFPHFHEQFFSLRLL